MVPESLSGPLAEWQLVQRDRRVNEVDFRHPGHWQCHWASYMGLSVLVIVIDSLFGATYFLLTHSGPDRVAFVLIAAMSAFAVLVAAFFVKAIASQSCRSCFSLGVTLSAGVVLTVSMTLNGELGSPLSSSSSLFRLSVLLSHLPIPEVASCGLAIERGDLDRRDGAGAVSSRCCQRCDQ